MLVAFPCSAPSGAKRAESHWRSRMIQYLLPMGSRDGTAVKVPVHQKDEGLAIVDSMALSSPISYS